MAVNRKLLVLLGIVLAGVAVSVEARLWVKGRHVAFVAVQVENHYDREGADKGVFLETHSVWGDGSTVQARQAIDGRPDGMRVITDVGRGVKIALDGETLSKTTYALSRGELERLKAKPDCVSLPKDGTILGYGVVRETRTLDIGEGRIVTTRKLAPALDCFPLSDSSEIEDRGGRRVASVSKTVTEVMRTEPDRAELIVARGYVERKPSEAMMLHEEPEGRQRPPDSLRTDAALDQVYAGRRERASGGSER